MVLSKKFVFFRSPSELATDSGNANVWRVNSTGQLNPWGNTDNSNGVRPASNFKITDTDLSNKCFFLVAVYLQSEFWQR